MTTALVIVVAVLAALIAFRTRGQSAPPRPAGQKGTGGPARGGRPPSAPGPRPGLRAAWRAQMATARRNARIAAAVIGVYGVYVLWKAFF